MRNKVQTRVSLNQLARLKYLAWGFPGAPLTNLLVEISNIDFLENHWSFQKVYDDVTIAGTRVRMPTGVEPFLLHNFLTNQFLHGHKFKSQGLNQHFCKPIM